MAAFAAKVREPGASFGAMAEGGAQVPHWQPSALAGEFVKMAYDEGWISTGFDWPAWIETDEAEAFLTNPPSIANATVDQLQKLLTAIIRSDRFSEGAIRE